MYTKLTLVDTNTARTSDTKPCAYPKHSARLQESCEFLISLHCQEKIQKIVTNEKTRMHKRATPAASSGLQDGASKRNLNLKNKKVVDKFSTQEFTNAEGSTAPDGKVKK